MLAKARFLLVSLLLKDRFTAYLLPAIALLFWGQAEAWTAPWDKSKDKGSAKLPPVQLSAEGDNTVENGIAKAEKNVELICGETSLYADKLVYDTTTGWATAEGHVRVYTAQGVMITGDKILYNIKTEKMEADDMRMASYPLVIGSNKLTNTGTPGKPSYESQFGLASPENLESPGFKLKPRKITYDPEMNRYVADDVTIYAGSVPVMWAPRVVYHPDGITTSIQASPGYKSQWGAFLLLGYGLEVVKNVHMKARLDTRSQRGVAGGADLKWIYGKGKESQPGDLSTQDKGDRGQGKASIYAADDLSPQGVRDTNIQHSPFWFQGEGGRAGRYRLNVEQRAFFTDKHDIYANLVFNKVTDRDFLRDFLEREYNEETQPDNFVELVKQDPNFAVTVLARKQVNKFYESVEREPEVRLDLKRQKILSTIPLEYNGQNSFVRLNRKFQDLDSPQPVDDYDTMRVDTFHQLSYPREYLGWLNINPRVGWRGTFYADSNTDGGLSDKNIFRSILNTGVEASFKLSRTWGGTSESLGLDGLRHVVEPFVNFSYMPNPSISPDRILQFDGRLPSTRLQPLDFPQQNSIDSIDNQLITRTGFRQKWQTKRDDMNWNLLEWASYIDVDAGRQAYNSNVVSNYYNEVEFKPVPWLSLDFFGASSFYKEGFNEYNSSLTWQVARPFEVTVGNRFLNNAPWLFDNSEQFYGTLFWRMNESWSVQSQHVFEAEDSRLEMQKYSIFRDFTAWKAAFTTEIRENRPALTGNDRRTHEEEYSFMLTLTFKSMP